MTLAQVHFGRQQQHLPPTALVQVVPEGEWLRADDVLEECEAFQPTRAHAAMAVVVGGPVFILLLHLLVFGKAGVVAPVVLLGCGLIGLLVLWTTHRLRTRRPTEILRAPGFLALAFLLVVPVEGIGAWQGAKSVVAHERIRAALSSPDKCAVRQVNGDLVLYGDEGEQDAAEMARLDCERIRNREDEARRGDEKCRRLAATSEVRLEDLLLERDQVGCGDATWNRIVGRLAASPDLWQEAFTLSNSMKSSLLEVGLSDNASAALKAHAESFAANAVRTGKLGDLSDAELLCHLAADFHAAPSSSCSAVPSKLQVARVNAAALDKAQAAAAAAKEARCQALENARNKCFSDRCLALDFDDPRNEQCEARCERQFPMPGCND